MRTQLSPHWTPDWRRDSRRESASATGGVGKWRDGGPRARPARIMTESSVRARSGTAPRRAQGLALLALLAAALALGPAPAHAAQPADGKVFVVAKYPVDARAEDAVAAKERAIADGQRGALRALLKRLVPVTAYGRVAQIKDLKAQDLIEGFSVRSERNSQTQYIATLDFSFQAEAIRALLAKHGLPHLEEQALPIVLVPVAVVDGKRDERWTRTWMEAWRGLDVDNALAPARVQAFKPEIHADTLKGLRNGENSMVRILSTEYRSDTVVAAIAEPDTAQRKLHVTLVGQDASGQIFLKRSYRLDGDNAYTSEFAAVVALGILEGRWKSVRGVGGRGSLARPASLGGGGGGDGPIQLLVEFRAMQEWQSISQRIQQVPGVEDVDAVLSARSARVSLRYPGGPEALAAALAPQGLVLRRSGDGQWLLQAR